MCAFSPSYLCGPTYMFKIALPVKCIAAFSMAANMLMLLLPPSTPVMASLETVPHLPSRHCVVSLLARTQRFGHGLLSGKTGHVFKSLWFSLNLRAQLRMVRTAQQSERTTNNRIWIKLRMKMLFSKFISLDCPMKFVNDLDWIQASLTVPCSSL